jgi:DNA-binding response OmpR family regulator
MTEDTILIVDHDSEFLEKLQVVLLLTGYRTVAVSSPGSVLPAARSSMPSVVLLDLDMPGDTSLRVASEIAECPETAGVPIIGMTAFPTEEEALVFLEAWGIQACLVKPFTFLNVVAKIELAQSQRRLSLPRCLEESTCYA